MTRSELAAEKTRCKPILTVAAFLSSVRFMKLGALGHVSIAPAPKEIEELLGKYLIAWNGREFQGVAHCFSAPAFFALPDVDIAISDHEAFVALLQKVFSIHALEQTLRLLVGSASA